MIWWQVVLLCLLSWPILAAILWGIGERIFHYQTGLTYAEAEELFKDMRSRAETSRPIGTNFNTFREYILITSDILDDKKYSDYEKKVVSSYFAEDWSMAGFFLPICLILSPLLLVLGLLYGATYVLKYIWKKGLGVIFKTLGNFWRFIFFAVASLCMIGTGKKVKIKSEEIKKGPYR